MPNEQCRLLHEKEYINADLTPVYVRNIGIRYEGKLYRSYVLADFIGETVLVIKKNNGNLLVYSADDKFITEAVIVPCKRS